MLIIFFIALPIYLFSSQIDVQKDTQESYKSGMEYYNSGDFKNSYEKFSKIYMQKLSDIKFNFYFGRSAYESGHYEVALAAFERVEMQDGSNIRNKLEMARTYFMLKMYEDSEIAFKDVLTNTNLPENIRRNIELSLSRVSKVQQKSFTYATLMMDFLYDSNVNYGSIGDYEYGQSTLPKIDEISDTALQVYGNVVNIYDIGNKNGYAIKNAISVYMKEYSDLDNYSVQYAAYTPSILYRDTKYTAELMLGMDVMKLGEHKYLSTISLTPRIEYNHLPTLKSIAHFKYQEKKFAREEQHDLDAKRFELSYGIQNILSPRSYIQGNLIGIKEKKIREGNIYVDFNEYKINAVYASQLSSDYGIEIYAQARERRYKDFSNGFGSRRNDTSGIGSVALSVKLLPTLRLKLKTSYEYVDSNQERFSYKKHTATAGLVKTF